MGINLVILWDRFYIFQSFLWSLTLAMVYWTFVSSLYLLYSDCYKINKDCSIIIPIITNPVKYEEPKRYLIFMASGEIIFQFLILNLFPSFYLVDTVVKMKQKE